MRLVAIGVVRSEWHRVEDAPKQGGETDAVSVLEILPEFEPAMDGLDGKQKLIVITWLHKSERNRLRVHPRGDASKPLRGVFSTRSPHRPNPIGHHVVDVLELSPRRIRVRGMDVIDGTPILDIKPFFLEPDVR